MDGVVFTTMHSAKGLEFRNDYIIGINEGTIPHEKSYDIEDEDKKAEQIEEERRLMYVGMTRAEESLTLSSPINKYGKKAFKSRFLDDIKNPTKEEIKGLRIGSKLYHKTFGNGRIVGIDGDMIKVKFEKKEAELDYKLCIRNNIIEML